MGSKMDKFLKIIGSILLIVFDLVFMYFVFLFMAFGIEDWSILAHIERLYFIIFSHIVCFMLFSISLSMKSSIKTRRILLMFSLLFIVLLLGTNTVEHIYYSSFTPEKWGKHVETRYLMINDLIADYKIIGKNEGDIEKLLGKMEDVDMEGRNQSIYKREGTCSGAKVKKYNMGISSRSLHRYEEDYLLIYFNKGNIATGYEAVKVLK